MMIPPLIPICISRFVPLSAGLIWENDKNMKFFHKKDCGNGLYVHSLNHCEIIIPKNSIYRVNIDMDLVNFSRKPASIAIELVINGKKSILKEYDFFDYEILFCDKFQLEAADEDYTFSIRLASENDLIIQGGEILFAPFAP